MIKIQFKKQTKIYNGEQTIEELQDYILKSFNLQPEQYQLVYEDDENDTISVSCQEDINSFQELQKKPKLQILVQKQHQVEEENYKKEEKIPKQKQAKKEDQNQKEKRRQKREKNIKKFFEECQKDENTKKLFGFLQDQLKQTMPLIEDFLKQDFKPQKQEEKQEKQEENQEEKQQENQEEQKQEEKQKEEKEKDIKLKKVNFEEIIKLPYEECQIKQNKKSFKIKPQPPVREWGNLNDKAKQVSDILGISYQQCLAICQKYQHETVDFIANKCLEECY